MIPSQWANALVGHRNRYVLGGEFKEIACLISGMGIDSLTFILIGLIVTWAGYVKRVRWTWFVLFIIVFGWAFPLMILPYFQMPIVLTASEWFARAVKEPGLARDSAEEVLIFSLMVIALFLPVKAFFWRKPAA